MSRDVFPLCILAWGQTMVGIMVTSFKRTYARSVVFNAPDPTGCHCQPTHLPEASGHSQASLAQSFVGSLLLSSGSWCSQAFARALKHLWQLWGLILNVIWPLLLSCWGFSFALGHGVSYFGGIQCFPVDDSVVTCNFGVLAGEDECTSFHSAVLWITYNNILLHVC